jgi:ubiquinone biosynthesis protein
MNISQDFRNLKRVEEILSALVKYELGHFVDLLKMKHIIPAHLRIRKNNYIKKETDPKTIRQIIEELGGSFIKLGQFLSLRPDLIPHEYCEEFRKLNDNVKPFSSDLAKEIAEKELKKKNKKLIYFNKKSIASGSIAQVHEAIMDTKKVILKIKRPNIDSKFESDIHILNSLAHLLNNKFEGIINLKEIVDEFKKYSENELNFLNEKQNIEIFYENFKDDKTIKIPEVYSEYCTEKIITMEYIHGIKFNQVLTFNNKRKKIIIKKLADSIFKQIFVYKIFHADPHPGNMLLIKDDNIALLDFGIIGNINQEMLNKLKLTFTSLIIGDPEKLTESFIQLGIAKNKVDKKKLSNDLKNLLKEYYNTSIEKVDLGLILNKSFYVAKKNKLHLPSELILLGKSIITLEGVCAEIDPTFNIVETYKPYLIEMEKKEIITKIKTKFKNIKNLFFNFPEKAERFMEDIEEVDQSMKEIDKDLKTLNYNIAHSVEIIGLSLLFIGFLVSSVILVHYGEPLILNIPIMSFIGFILSFIFLIILLYKLFKKRKKYID